MPRKKIGRILVIGGAEDPDESEMILLPRFVELAGGSQARVFLCTSPSATADESPRAYRKLFRKLGVADVHETSLDTPAAADDPQALEALESATAVFMCGDDQLRLASAIGGTTLARRIEERVLREGMILAGTGAGACALGSPMIIGGESAGTVRRSDVELAPGLGLWRDAVVDTHFNQRGRVSRLMTVCAHNPRILGIGIDEDTALELVPGKRFTVLGSGTATVIDGRITHTNAPEQGYSDTLTVTDMVVHVLGAGYGFDLETQRPTLPDRTGIPEEELAVAV